MDKTYSVKLQYLSLQSINKSRDTIIRVLYYFKFSVEKQDKFNIIVLIRYKQWEQDK